MIKVIIRTDQVEGFFDRARKAAQRADRGESFKKAVTFCAEDSRAFRLILFLPPALVVEPMPPLD
jgi:hypothetical protein